MTAGGGSKTIGPDVSVIGCGTIVRASLCGGMRPRLRRYSRMRGEGAILTAETRQRILEQTSPYSPVKKSVRKTDLS